MTYLLRSRRGHNDIMGIKIKQAKLSDQVSVMPQMLVFEQQHAEYEDGKITEKTHQRVKEELLRAIRKKKYWVAEKNQRVVGFIKAEILDTRPGVLYIDNLFVHPDHRSQGIATALISFVETIFKKKGINKIRLYVAQQNIIAENLYKRLGFEFHQDIWKEYIKELR